jgi:hypothetical protein
MYREIYRFTRDPDRLHLAELSTQCALAKQAYEHLSIYFRVVGRRESPHEPLGYSPLQILSHGVGFLAAAATISKILFPSSGSAARGERLRNRLKIDDLPNIRSRAVRNSYEHIDERVDELSPQHLEDDICLIDITSNRTGTATVMKRVDPVRATIEFLDEATDVEGCFAEVQAVDNAVKANISLERSRGR